MRERRTREQVEQLEREVMDVLALDHPQSVRHVFYRLTDPRLPEPVAKTELGYRVVQQRIVSMREAGRLPYGWIADATRRGWFTNTFAGAGDFVDRFAGLYRANAWQNTEVQVEVWCESRSLAGVLQDDCQRLAVDLFPCGGFVSKTFAYEGASAMNADGRPAVVYFVGDYDPAGVLIDRALERELTKHLKVSLEFVRLAINKDQIGAYDLPTKPRKPTEVRRPDVRETVEAEAMPAAILRGLVSDAVESHLPAGILDRLKVVEEDERAGLRLLADHLTESGLDDVLDRLD